jgi:hypothetical protein
MKKMFLLVILIFISFIQNSVCQIIDPKSEYYLTNRIISFEYISNSVLDSMGNNIFEYRPLATGFCINYKDRVFLITCKHVINKIIKNHLGMLIIRYPYYDKINDDIKTVRLSTVIKNEIYKTIIFSKDTCYDVCVIDYLDILWNSFPLILLDTIKTNYQISAIPYSQIINSTETLYELNNIYFMGYPFGLSGKKRNYLIFRSGIISAIIDDDYGDICGRHYLINSESFGGDSGSPVFLITSPHEKLIGILSGNYETGLSIVEPIDEVLTIISEYLKKKK